MAQLLTWSDVDTNIQAEMGNQSPSETRRLEAINNAVRAINNDYDVTTARRSAAISVIPDGTATLLSGLITDDDVKKIDSIFPASDNAGRNYQWVEKNKFFRNINDSVNVDEYTTYFDNGVMYIAMNSQEDESVAVSFTMEYFSTFLGSTSANVFIEEITAGGTDNILMPSKFKDLIVYGAVKRLLYQSLGEEGNNQLSIVRNRYKSELTKLGLDSITKPLKREVRKVKIHNPV